MSYTEFLEKRDRLSTTLRDCQKIISRVRDPAYTQLSSDGLSLLVRRERELESQLEELCKEYGNANK
jgi:hypothetical protein